MIRRLARKLLDCLAARLTPKAPEGGDPTEEQAAEAYLRSCKKKLAIKWLNDNKWHPLMMDEDISPPPKLDLHYNPMSNEEDINIPLRPEDRRVHPLR